MRELRDVLTDYAARIRADRAANARVQGEGAGLERLLAPRFQALVEALLCVRFSDRPAVRVLPEWEKPSIGRPDLAFAPVGGRPRAFLELKSPETDLDRLRGHDRAQFARFAELPLWALSNFHTIRLFRRNEMIAQAAIVPKASLDPEAPTRTLAKTLDALDPQPLLDIVAALALAAPPRLASAKEVAEALAHAARLVRNVVRDACREGPPAALADVRAEFRDTLFAHAEDAGFEVEDENRLFADAFAQTLAFGLLLARESGSEVGEDAHRRLDQGSYPLLRATLRALTQEEILAVLGAAFDVLVETVNAVDPALLARRNGTDPVLYFYEDFLAAFDPEARRKHGVYFTPVPVVRFMVAEVDRALREHLGTDGLLDRGVLVLDPACGTGTFLIAAAAQAAERAEREMGEAAVPGAMSALAKRLFGFELLVGPYAVAHYRLQRELRGRGANLVERLGIYLADTLRPPGESAALQPRLGFLSAPLVEERREADRVKRDTPILAIFGNPPYRRLAAGEEERIVSGWAKGFWEDLKKPVRDAGWGGELNTFPDLYIAFWRWCLWKLFESEGAPKRGVVCLITNRTFLAGHPYAGLRKMLRERFDRIAVLDLRGDRRGARPAGVAADEGVFAVEVGVAITLAVADGSKRPGTLAPVTYADVWRQVADGAAMGLFRREEKEAFLESVVRRPRPLAATPVAGGPLDDFRPPPFEDVDGVSIGEVFVFRSSGTETKRDDLVYALTREELEARLAAWLSLPEAQAEDVFNPTDLKPLSAARTAGFDGSFVVPVSYRPFDRRFHYAHPAYNDRLRPDLRRAWGQRNVALHAMAYKTGSGPAVWAHGLVPDRHAFRGSFGGYVFPLWDRRLGQRTHNLNRELLRGLAAAYGRPVGPEEVFHAVTALLSATSYTLRFADDLETAFPHVVFPAEAAAFGRAAEIGAQIVALETFARRPEPRFRTARLEGRAEGAVLALPRIGSAFLPEADRPGFGAVPLTERNAVRMTGVPERVYTFDVSGYRVLYNWLKARQGRPLAAVQDEALDVAWRLNELLHWFDAADEVLQAALAAPLPRAALTVAQHGGDG